MAEAKKQAKTEIAELPVEEEIAVVNHDAEKEAMSEKEIAKVDSLVEGVPVKLNETASVENKSSWKPKTSIGKKVAAGEITDISDILEKGEKILELEIVDTLLPNLQNDLLLIGQAKGKFGGGQRRVFKTTQKKSMQGNKPRFAAFGVVGNCDGYVGVGYGKSKETVPAREKAFRRAKLAVMKIRRGCGSWKCNCGEPHSIPFQVRGKCGSSIMILMPAPKGTGLKVENECAKILKLAGIKDAWSKTLGQTKTKINLIQACTSALQQLNTTKIKSAHISQLGIVDGHLKTKDVDAEFMEAIKAPELHVNGASHDKSHPRERSKHARGEKQ